MAAIESGLLRALSDRARCARWSVTPERFAVALEHSIGKAFPDGRPSNAAAEKYFQALHLEDLALACACEDGHDEAWEHFVREFRPQLYRAAGAIDSTGGARELADAIYGELFGLKEKDGVRQSLFRYFHGRSSLATWLRSVLSQRMVDRARAQKRLEPLPDEGAAGSPVAAPAPEPDGLRQVEALGHALAAVIADLPDRDRLRLACYYAQDLTLAQIGRLTGEHEATVSRHLTRTRKSVRRGVEARLKQEYGMADPEIAECFAAAAADAGELNLGSLLNEGPERKDPDGERST